MTISRIEEIIEKELLNLIKKFKKVRKMI